MAYSYEYPYTDASRANADWILNKIKEISKELSDFVITNEIKFAEPISWDISKQYEKNTIVINDDIAYLSKKEVPTNVNINDANYWLKINDWSVLFDSLKKSITRKDDKSSITSTENREKGELVWLNNNLYVVLRHIETGDAYIKTLPNPNILLVSINEIIGNLEDLNTENKNSVVSAINSLKNELLKDVSFVTPEMFGAVGDGSTDDSAAWQEALDTGKAVIGMGEYLIETGLRVVSQSYNQRFIIFNKLTYTGNDYALTCVGRNMYVKGGAVYTNTGNCVSIGDGETGCIQSFFEFTEILSRNGNGYLLKPSANMNIQDISIKGGVVYFGNYGMLMDTTLRWVGQITLYSMGFAYASDSVGAMREAIYCDCDIHGMTGINFVDVSFEGVSTGAGAIKAVNTHYDGKDRSFAPINGTIRVQEVMFSHKPVYTQTGDGRVFGTLHTDIIEPANLVIEPPHDVETNRLTIFGRIRYANKTFSEARLMSNKLVVDYNTLSSFLNLTSDTTFASDSTMPPRLLRLSGGSATINIKEGFYGDIKVVSSGANQHCTINGHQYTLQNGESLEIYVAILGNDTFRTFVKNNVTGIVDIWTMAV